MNEPPSHYSQELAGLPPADRIRFAVNALSQVLGPEAAAAVVNVVAAIVAAEVAPINELIQVAKDEAEHGEEWRSSLADEDDADA